MTKDQRLSRKMKNPAGESEGGHDEVSSGSLNSSSPSTEKMKKRLSDGRFRVPDEKLHTCTSRGYDYGHIDVNESRGAFGFTKPPGSSGAVDKYVSVSNPEFRLTSHKRKKQPNISDDERSNKVKELLCIWAFENDIPPEAFELDSFKSMLEAIGRYGPGFKPPTVYELKGPLLKKEVERTKDLLKTHEEEWQSNGCSIMIDVWSEGNWSVMYSCVNSKSGTAFLYSKGSSDFLHTSEVIHKYVEKYIQQVGPENVVQIVANDALNNVGAAKLLKQNRPTIFWSSCAAHTINLMLESIASLPRFKKVIDQAKALSTFIFAHHETLAMMRSYTENEGIVRPGVTRFASSLLTLECFIEKKRQLMAMFISEEWDRCKLSKTVRGEASYKTVLSRKFWNRLSLCLKVFAPLAKVLRTVICNRKPSMGFVYGELLQAKEDIKKALGNISEKYQPVIEIIDAKIKDRLDSPLHLMACLLNPYYLYKNPLLELDQVVSSGVLDCVVVMFEGNITMQDKIVTVELPKYKRKDFLFGEPVAVRQCTTVSFDKFDPVKWWSSFGAATPNLQKMAIRILSLVSSSWGCEKYWSAFDPVWTKKVNGLNANQLNDLAFVHINMKLLNQQKRESNGENVEVLLASDASHAQDWIGGGVVDDDDEVRELSGDEFESDEEEDIDEYDWEFGSDNE